MLRTSLRPYAGDRHLPRKQRGQPELYNLSVDPSESKNVAADHPEILKRLSAKVKAWVASLPTQYTKTKDKQD